ncbi:hypothetical protein CHLRE_10g436500v5 [Chlamydomonas reinhardtii]|uniref:Survival protein SurE-like phosphatase/nucleotidase domain-containing protein n=1 Tax=Chlamydomonas reinhardtii TaxID=3055 RepID=A8IGE2_CHLRE|nr:uncharacterized protein CHLRE_10g436500v5 [Chlamydomonas reinhardtii]PNW77438.1 hypothetical protein CHLRE_10g436500v5 [Chlamydomonas reinhardtii]|eukprot:XP_001690585.1 predicted protein [Chlamydomonas reinhardtii]
MPRPRILISNDDGINAPGIKALVAELVKADFADVYVCAPSGERSAQSHAITLGRYLSCVPTEPTTAGVVESYAVDGTPADSVMLALCSPVFQDVSFDLMISGINRGDNAGLHVIYSGTVGAAREAACKGIPAMALSLDNHLARKTDDYAVSASLAVALAKAALGVLPGQEAGGRAPAASLKGVVINVNFPIAQGQMLQGLFLARQSLACVFPAFKEVTEAPGPHLAEIDEHTPNSRVFRNYAGMVQEDQEEGNDAYALKNGWVAVTPLSLLSHIQLGQDPRAENVVNAVSQIVTRAAAEAGLSTGGIPAKL